MFYLRAHRSHVEHHAVGHRTLGEKPSVDSRRRISRRSGAGAIVSTPETAQILSDAKRAGL